MKKIALIIGIAMVGIGMVAVSIFGVFIGKYNAMVNLSQNVDSKWSQVQNIYQRRSDLIPNLVNTVKGAAKFEKDTFIGIAEARASVGRVTIDRNKAPESAEQLEAFNKAQGNISQALSRLMIISEQYPQLTATQQFRDLTVSIEGCENRISVERREFNLSVETYNKYISNVPNNFVAGWFGFKTKPYFQANEKAQNAPVVSFE